MMAPPRDGRPGLPRRLRLRQPDPRPWAPPQRTRREDESWINSPAPSRSPLARPRRAMKKRDGGDSFLVTTAVLEHYARQRSRCAPPPNPPGATTKTTTPKTPKFGDEWMSARLRRRRTIRHAGETRPDRTPLSSKRPRPDPGRRDRRGRSRRGRHRPGGRPRPSSRCLDEMARRCPSR